MGYYERRRITLTTTGSSSTATYSPPFNGAVHSISYYKHATTPPSTVADLLITVAGTSQTVLTTTGIDASYTKFPRDASHTTAGTSEATRSSIIAVANDRLKFDLSKNSTGVTVATWDLIIDGAFLST